VRISLRSANILRALTFVTFGAAAVLGVYNCSQTTPARQTVETGPGELTVRDSVGRLKPVTIKGYLFNDVATKGFQLCDRRDPGRPPRCVGPAIALGAGFDGHRFNLHSAKDKAGVTITWADDPIVVKGTLDGMILNVDQLGG
jgi:hypothetical protein